MRSAGIGISKATIFYLKVLAGVGLASTAATWMIACRTERPDLDRGKTQVEIAAPQVVSFPTSDGGFIYADWYGEGKHAVVLAHVGRFTKESWKDQAPILVRAGFRVLAIDFRGRGKSRGGPHAQGREDRHYLDVLAAVRYVREAGATTVSVVGASFGGGAAARAAVEAGSGEIDRLVLMAHSAIDRPERMKGRKLFITTRDDFSGSGTLRLPSIRDQYDRAEEPKELVILKGSAHAQHVFETEQGPRMMEEILRFLSAP